jgi:hypothetical protein
MRIAVLGTGTVGRTLAGKLAELGHDVRIGTRDPDATLARDEPDAMRRQESFREWLERHPQAQLVRMAEAADGAELVANATNGTGSVAALEAAGAQHLAGTVVMDVANPLKFSDGTLSLFISNTDSLGERLQLRFPQARVVKTLNTVNASVMVAPTRVAGGDHTMFVAGNDAEAKAVVTGLLESFGWVDVLDLGGIEAARGMEMYLILWATMRGVIGDPLFSIKVARPG